MTLQFSRASTFVLATLALFLVAPAVAQDIPTVLPNGYAMSDVLNKQRIGIAINAVSPVVAHTAPSGAPQTAELARPAGAAITPTSYNPSPEVSARVRHQFAAWLAKEAGKEVVSRVGEMLDERDPVLDWSRIVEAYGLRSGDMADAMASYWILNWMVANRAEASPVQALAVRDQVRRMVNPAYVRLGGEARQEISELLILNYLIQHAAYADAVKRGDHDAVTHLSDAAVTRFTTEMGVDLRRLILTDAGFARAG